MTTARGSSALLRAIATLWLVSISSPALAAQYAYIGAPFHVSVIDTADGRVVSGPFAVPDSPAGTVPSPDGERIYALSVPQSAFFGLGTGRVSVLEVASGRVVTSVPVASLPAGIALSRDGRQLFTSDGINGFVAAFDTETFEVRVSTLIQCAGHLALSPDGTILYVACGVQLKRLRVADLVVTGSALMNSEGIGPLAVSSDGATLYTTLGVQTILGLGYAIAAVSTDTLATKWQVLVAQQPHTAALSADGNTLYVTFPGAPGSGEFAFIDPASGARRQALAIPEGPTTVAVSRDGRSAFVRTRSGPVVVIDLVGRTRTGELSTAAGAATLVLGDGRVTTATLASAVEFYHASLDHYFLTVDPNEIDDLHRGVHEGWQRTGQSFLAYASGKASGRGDSVCRFYGLPSAGLDSHFYSAHATECDDVARKFSASWKLEAPQVFEAPLPDLVTGVCPFGAVPVYRLWNARADSNHRYTTDPDVRLEMLGRGFVAEGYGPLGVGMCAETQANTAP